MNDDKALITLNEAEELVARKAPPLENRRTMLMVAVGIIVVILITIIVMILLSLRGTKTGLSAILPFLGNGSQSNSSLQF